MGCFENCSETVNLFFWACGGEAVCNCVFTIAINLSPTRLLAETDSHHELHQGGGVIQPIVTGRLCCTCKVQILKPAIADRQYCRQSRAKSILSEEVILII